jgi:hypothetical protein
MQDLPNDMMVEINRWLDWPSQAILAFVLRRPIPAFRGKIMEIVLAKHRPEFVQIFMNRVNLVSLRIQAVAKQNCDLLNWIFNCIGTVFGNDTFANVYFKLTIPMCELLNSKVKLTSYCQAVLAGRCGSIAVLEWMRDHGWVFTRHTMQEAAREGLEVVKWLRNFGCPWPWSIEETFLNNAAFGGHLDLLQWYTSEFMESNIQYPSILTAAVRGGHFAVAKWLRQRNVKWSVMASRVVGISHNMELIQWAIDDGIPTSSELIKKIITLNKIELAKKLYANFGGRVSRVLISAIIKSNDNEFIETILNNEHTLSVAVEIGRVDLIRRLYNPKQQPKNHLYYPTTHIESYECLHSLGVKVDIYSIKRSLLHYDSVYTHINILITEPLQWLLDHYDGSIDVEKFFQIRDISKPFRQIVLNAHGLKLFDLPSDIHRVIAGLCTTVDTERMARTCKRIYGILHHDAIPDWIVYDTLKIQTTYPEYWETFCLQMQLVNWPKLAPTHICAKRKQRKLTMQWICMALDGSSSNCTVSFVVGQKNVAHWHRCRVPRSASHGLCGCTMTTTVAKLDIGLIGGVLPQIKK